MSNTSDEQLSKSRTTYRNLHQPPSPMNSPTTATKKKILPSEGSDDDDDSTLPTFVNRFFFPENTPASASSNDTGVFRAIRGQVIIHHDRSSKVQHEDELDDDNDNDVEEELENLSVTRTNQGNYELHYDVDNPLEISYSMSLSSAETISDHSPSPVRHTSLIHINGFKSTIERAQTPVEPSDDDDTPSSIVSDTDHRETKNTIDHDTMKEQDEKLRTFRGWHLSMLKQIDEKLREIEQETTVPSTTSANGNKKAPVKSSTNKKPRKAFARPTIRRRFEANTFQRHHSPLPNNHSNAPRPRTPPVEKESRTLIINLPPSSSSSSSSCSSSSDIEHDLRAFATASSDSAHVRIVASPSYPMRQRSQSSDRSLLRDQGAQTEPFMNSFDSIHHRSARPSSVESERTRSLTRVQGAQFVQQQQQRPPPRPTEQIKFYSLRSRNIQSRPSIVTQSPRSTTKLPLTPPLDTAKDQMHVHVPPVTADPCVYSDDYGHVTQMDTSNLGTLVDRVFDDISQDKPSDFYRDYRQLLNDIQIRFSMITPVDQPSAGVPRPPPPPLLAMHRPVARPPPPPTFVDYPQAAPNQARHCDTLIYIPHSR